MPILKSCMLLEHHYISVHTQSITNIMTSFKQFFPETESTVEIGRHNSRLIGFVARTDRLQLNVH
jgi:hypothetical protein